MRPLTWGITGFILLIGIWTTAYTVPETERALVLVLGQISTDSAGKPRVVGPGLHFKLPFVSTVVTFDKRLQTLDIQDSRIVTREQKDVLVNSFVKWRIHNFAEFYKATSGVMLRAEELLEQKVSDGLRAQFGRSTIRQVVSEDRDTIMQDLSSAINESASSLGIEVTDVRIKRIDLPDEVSHSVFERMRAERQQVAAAHRADGEKESEMIRANADEQAVVIKATAESEGQRLRGIADAEVARIYAKAYNQDPEFYAFYRSLLAYKASFSSETDFFVLSPDSEFFKYFGNK